MRFRFVVVGLRGGFIDGGTDGASASLDIGGERPALAIENGEGGAEENRG